MLTSPSSHDRRSSTVPTRLRAAPLLALLAMGSFAVACGGSLAPREGEKGGAGAPDAGAPREPPTSYPPGMIAAYGPGGSGVSFFTYDTGTGFVPIGALASGAWQTDACEQIAFDAQRNLYLTCTQYASEPTSRVLVFANGAMNESEPIRVITGPRIASSNLVGSAVDSKGNVYVVAQTGGGDAGPVEGAVVVFGPSSDSVPVRVIQGPATQLVYPNQIAIDRNDNLYVGSDGVPVVEFAPGADGNATPTAQLGVGACGGTEGLAVDATGRVYLDCVPSSNTPDPQLPSGADGILVFSDTGTVERTINGPASAAYELLTLAVDRAGRIFAGDYYGPDGGTGVYVYGAGASGDVAPEATLTTVSGLAVAVAP